ncbi:uncharacterized protein [Hyperolius riggenbachi]|uniref:uncharacterized protein n=1 Tax=Hyperolius riggenbachi TaxID=752182 RepID=UPI0035A38D2F
MAGVIKDILRQALKDISEKSLKSLKRKLSEIDLPKHNKIPLSDLEDKDAEGVVDLIISHYTIQDGPEIVVRALHDINERQVSAELQEKFEDEDDEMNIIEKTPRKRRKKARSLRSHTNGFPTPSNHHFQRLCHGKENTCYSPQRTSPQGSATELTLTQSTNYQPICARKALNMGLGCNIISNNQLTIRRVRGESLPDITLKTLTKQAVISMTEDHKGKAHIYAKLLFMYFVPFEEFKIWARCTNFDGSGGKRAIPANLRTAIMKQVRKKFGLLSPEAKRDIKKTINQLLRDNPPKSEWPLMF